MKIGTSTFAFVLAACCEHPMIWRIMWALYYLTKEAKLSGSNHVHNTQNVIEHSANLLIANVLFLDFCYGDMKDVSDAMMEGYFKFPEKGMSK